MDHTGGTIRTTQKRTLFVRLVISSQVINIAVTVRLTFSGCWFVNDSAVINYRFLNMFVVIVIYLLKSVLKHK